MTLYGKIGHSAASGPIRCKCRRQNTALSLVVSTVAIMSEAKNLARALNLSHRDGLDMMGGADAEAMAPGSEDPLSDCKSLITVNYNPHQFIIFFSLFFR